MSEQEINMRIAKNIAYYMELRNLTQKEIAEYVGVTQASVSNWCKGIKMPRMDKFDKLCELFGCNRSDLIDEDPVEDENARLIAALERAFNERPEMRTLFSIAEKATADDVEKTIKILETLRGE